MKKVFDSLSEKEKKYIQKSNKDKKRYDNTLIFYEQKIFGFPRKPCSNYNFFIKERIPPLRKEKNSEPIKNVNKKFYEEKAAADKRRFHKQLKEFNQIGYYTKDSPEDEPENVKGEKKKSSFKGNMNRKRKSKSKKRTRNL